MAGTDQDLALREAARARGFKLVKSRRRKPGGDFGRFGLVGIDSGRECLGFGADGLTATAEEVHTYLRGGEVASWKRSLIGLVAEEPASPQKREDVQDRPAAASAAKRKATSSHSSTGRRTGGSMKTTAASTTAASAREAADGTSADPPVEHEPLTIREASRRDAAALSKLTQIPGATLAERVASAIGRGEPPLIALRGEAAIGLAAWTTLSTLHLGQIGRITMLLVAEGERRQGIGTALLQSVERHLAEAGVTSAELLLDIDFDAPTAFLRGAGWARTTNGYGKETG
jgi:GNAT superfamily N-acetyltransferase